MSSSDQRPDLAAALLRAAAAVRARAYAPYSGYRVGAAVLDEAGFTHVGCNVENAAFPIGTCAEAGAVAAMVASGGCRVVAVAVVADGPDLVTPCGACRQRLREFASDDVQILLGRPGGSGGEGELGRTVTLGELLPLSFGPAHLLGHR